MNFLVFKNAVAKQFEKLAKNDVLYRTGIIGNDLWDVYMDAFPEGTNNIFKVRREYECNCCKSFIRAVGNVVGLVNGKLTSIWDIDIPSEPVFNEVAKKLHDAVMAKNIETQFWSPEKTAGVNKTFHDHIEGVSSWDHFYVTIPVKFVKIRRDIPSLQSEVNSAFSVFYRGLTELTSDAIDTVIDLISSGSLYRGDEHKGAVNTFKTFQTKFLALPENERVNFAWTQNAGPALSRFRNSAIGTLVDDLSKGVDLNIAVRSFEAKVAPANYQRTSAPVSKQMIINAQKAIEEAGLTSALGRRAATISDITINDLIFANRNLRKALQEPSVFDSLVSEAAKNPKKFDRVEEVSIEKFLKDMVPNASSIEVLFEGKHKNNLVSLIAPEDPSCENLFKWDNRFSWSYNGEFADAIKERVKAAGGNVSAPVCVRLAWSNYDDLDLHVYEPGGNRIYFGNRRSQKTGGQLDVDMNAGGGTTREPVENIFYQDINRMPNGKYEVNVNQFSKRESSNVGFTIQLDLNGEVHEMSYPFAVSGTISVCTFEKKGNTFTVKIGNDKITSSSIGQNIWNIDTNQFHQVQAICLSPNFWNGQEVGNKHYMFMLENCKNDGSARGFFNEMLGSKLQQHRKVLELVASKSKPIMGDDQFSGLGFSSTVRNTLVCRVNGAVSRLVKIVF